MGQMGASHVNMSVFGEGEKAYLVETTFMFSNLRLQGSYTCAQYPGQ